MGHISLPSSSRGTPRPLFASRSHPNHARRLLSIIFSPSLFFSDTLFSSPVALLCPSCFMALMSPFLEDPSQYCGLLREEMPGRRDGWARRGRGAAGDWRGEMGSCARHYRDGWRRPPGAGRDWGRSSPSSSLQASCEGIGPATGAGRAARGIALPGKSHFK